MSRGFGRGGRGGRGGGRGGFGGANNPPPMGLSFTDLQNLSREATALYPPTNLPVFSEPSSNEAKIAELQLSYAARLRRSPYYVIERTKTTELERYSDKYRPSVASQPTLKRKDLHEPFFPKEILEDYFNPKRKKKSTTQAKAGKAKLNLDELAEDADDPEKSSEERSDAGSQVGQESDYDVDEEYDNDYAENYFDNGEGEDMDDVGGGGGGDEGGDQDGAVCDEY
ncbi:DNA-directed RNA polymerase III, subunit Rpc31 [Crepidotus variabilis]|uniref:DNA-directed RNA polymerase III subunit n=1 Tax=Crepidotus variabilis TaxID=179855 RepID=A0A9P6E5B0_9AGAR|nr:DNA-directed RNA polymerase III, subunit Rpc31 [Crepidotus variabilis]